MSKVLSDDPWRSHQASGEESANGQMNPDKGFVVVLRCHSGKLVVSNRETNNPAISGKLIFGYVESSRLNA